MEKYTVDAISGGKARLLLQRDENVSLVVPAGQLPGVREGDIISAQVVAGEVRAFVVERAETEAQKKRIQQLLDKLRNRPGP